MHIHKHKQLSLKVPIWWKIVNHGFIIVPYGFLYYGSETFCFLACHSIFKLPEPQTITSTRSITWSISRIGRPHMKLKLIPWIERFILHDEKSIQGICCCKEIFYCKAQLCLSTIDNEVELSMLFLLLFLPIF